MVFWAKNKRSLDEIFDRLEAAGFDISLNGNLKVSAGIYHAPFLDFKYVIDLAKEYYSRYGKKLLIDCEVQNESEQQSFQKLITDMDAQDYINMWFRTNHIHVGRGETLEAIDSKNNHYDTCDIMDQLTVDPDGSVRSCCGMNYQNDGIRVGSIFNDDLSKLIRLSQNDPLTQFISNYSMEKLFDFLHKSAESLPIIIFVLYVIIYSQI